MASVSGLEEKLPKLVITRFDSRYQDWPRFWSQFREIIDKKNIASVTKFAYLRELLESKVRKTIEALPFTNEGYNHAKSILQDKFGKESEIIKAYTKQIIELPTIPNVNVRKIHEFSDKFMYCIQSLQTMGKLEQVNGNAAMILDKMLGIRRDLFRTDAAWEDWDFVKLSEALRLCTHQNPLDQQQKQTERVPESAAQSRDRPNKLFHAKSKAPMSQLVNEMA